MRWAAWARMACAPAARLRALNWLGAGIGILGSLAAILLGTLACDASQVSKKSEIGGPGHRPLFAPQPLRSARAHQRPVDHRDVHQRALSQFLHMEPGLDHR